MMAGSIMTEEYKRRMIMKKWIIALSLLILALPIRVLADGKDGFNANCVKCHGGSPSTNTRRALVLKVSPQKIYLPASEMNKDEMIAITQKGKNMMPAFENKLTNEQITAIIDYVTDLKKKYQSEMKKY